MTTNTGLSYNSQAEKDADKALLDQCREALYISASVLRLDDCELWNLAGKTGRITTWGDGKGYLLHLYDEVVGGRQFYSRSKRAWSAAKKRLPFAVVKQNGEAGGVLRFELPLTGEQAAEVRELAGLRKQLSEEARANMAERGRQSGFGIRTN